MSDLERRHTAEFAHGPEPAGFDPSIDPRILAEQMRQLAYRDPLTGLLNRRGFDEELRRLWNLGPDHAFPMGLLIVDVDHFKAINDSFGHFVGDQVLKECARLMQASVRESDVVCRDYGGDEMVAILPKSDKAGTRLIAERMAERFRTEVICKGSYDLRMSISVGVCHIASGAEPTADRFLIQADRALYRAKQTGRNKICFADELPEPIGEAPAGALAPAPAGMADSRRTVLVADDDRDICRFFERVLERDGYNVLVAHSGAEALAHMEKASGMVDVALVDLRLGGEDGLDVLKTLRAMDESVVGVVITGAATLDNAVEAMRLGSFDFVQKPVSAGQLSAVLARAVKYRRLLLENKRYQMHLEDMVREKSAALSRALDFGVFHEINPTGGAVVAAMNGGLTDTTNLVEYAAADKPYVSLDAADALVLADGYLPRDIALAPTYASKFSSLRGTNSEQKLYPNFKLTPEVSELDNHRASVSNTVSGAGVIAVDTKVLGFVGDFSAIRWGIQRDLGLELIKYGDPDGGGDLKRNNQVAFRAEVVYGWGIASLDAFAKIHDLV